ncbi:MAG TPA: hypothetical protein VNX68_11000 [Nitrosopumilaceae archaeon]|nr:hypothetical protein [Nitrosopumilaceae archaeon]
MSSFYLQKKFHLVLVKPLDGIKDLPQKPKLSIPGVFSGGFQDSMNLYLNDNMGFRPWLVRLSNEIKFRGFDLTNAPGVVMGKGGQLFIESYINNFVGTNFVGKNKADEIVRKIKRVQDSLKVNNIDLIIVFAPGKASYYPECIPDKYTLKKRDTTNYNYYSTQFVMNGVNFIDFNKYFGKYKYDLQYPMYPEYGTHWTSYGSALAMDSIIRYIEKKRAINLPWFDYSDVEMRDSLEEREYDIGILLNLFRQIPHEPMPYIKYKYGSNASVTKPDVLAIGDSYWWCMVSNDISSNVFKQDEYWFYNKDIYKRNVKQEKGVPGINFGDETINRDVIILMATEATFDLFPYGFIDKAYNIYCLSNDEKRELIEENINNDPNWKKDIVNKAKQNKIGEKEQLERDIDFVFKTDYCPVRETKIALGAVLKEYEDKIRQNAEWLEQIKKKASEKGIIIQEQIQEDARYTYDMEYGSAEVKRALRDIRCRIRNTKEWWVQIQKKAAEKKINAEEMLELDVKFVFDTERNRK